MDKNVSIKSVKIDRLNKNINVWIVIIIIIIVINNILINIKFKLF